MKPLPITTQAQDRFDEIVTTRYAGGVVEREALLRRWYEQQGILYSREDVRQRVYDRYVVRGGWRCFAYITSYLFQEDTNHDDL